jgi:transcriptional regulator with GAF, ATPase, and Fis domain
MSRPQIDPSQRSIDKSQQSKPVGGPEAVPPGSNANDQPIASLRSVRTQVEIQAIIAALKRTGWNRKQAARLLEISYRGLLYKIHRHRIVPMTESR